jgi:uncharacterized lipoprotein YajG
MEREEVTMKKIFFLLLSLFLLAGCKEKNDPLTVKFTGKTFEQT